MLGKEPPAWYAGPSLMLNLFRQRGLASVVYGVIIFATIAVFVIQFRPNAGQKTASLNEACVARVRGTCIEPKDARAAYLTLMPKDQQGNRLQAKARQMGLSHIALEGLIDRELLVGEADRLGLKVTDDEVTNQLYEGWVRVSVPAEDPAMRYRIFGPPRAEIPQGMLPMNFRDPKTKQFDMKIYERAIKNGVGRSPTEFREQQAKEILAAKVRDLVTEPVRVSEEEAFGLYATQKSNAQITYLPIKQSWVERWGVQPGTANLDAWAKDPANASLVDTTVKQREPDDDPKENHVRHILVKTPPNATEDDLRAAAVKIARAHARLAAGSSFAEIAREMSDDKGSALRGGDVGEKTDGFVAPFKAAADALKPGQTTPTAIQTQFGLHLITKDDPTTATPERAAMRKDVTRELFVKAKAAEKTKAIVDQLLADVKSGTKPEDAIAKIVASMPKPAAPLAPYPFTREKKPDLDGGADATTSAVTTTSATDAKTAPKPEGPDTDANRPEAVTGSSFNKGGEPVPGLSPDAEQKVVTFAFTAKEGDWSEPIRAEDGWVVALLKDQKLVTKDDFAKEKSTFMTDLLEAKRAEALSLYTKRLRAQAKDAESRSTRVTSSTQQVDGGAPGEDEDERPVTSYAS